MKELCWLKPKLVAQISFTEWTNDGLLRHATFEGLHDDSVVCEIDAGYLRREQFPQNVRLEPAPGADESSDAERREGAPGPNVGP